MTNKETTIKDNAMKRFILFMLCIGLCGTAYSQKDYRYELFVSYGFSPLESIYEPGIDFPYDPILGPAAVFKAVNSESSGTFNAGFLIHVSKPFAIGLSYTYNSTESDLFMGSEQFGEFRSKCNTVMFNAKYRWLNIKSFSFYSRAAAGIMMKKGETKGLDSRSASLFNGVDLDENTFAWHISPIGVDWNFVRHLALFAEGGVGACGYAMAGIKIRL